MRTILIALVVLCLSGCGSGTGKTGNTSKTGDLLTLANYNQIKVGMTVDEVDALIGPGEKASSGEGGEGGSILVITTYRWEWNSADLTDIRTVTISYENGSVTTMTQFGLP